VIVVIGSIRLRGAAESADPAGLAASVAIAAAGDGSQVELVGRLGDDPSGDTVLLGLARRGVGHVAILRDPARPTVVVPDGDVTPDPDEPAEPAVEPGPGSPPVAAPTLDAADLELALRYLPEISVIVAVHLDADLVAEAVAATDWAETSLVVVVPADAAAPEGLPARSVTLAVADDDESSAGALIGRFVAALDRGEPSAEAYDALLATVRA
jgi:hypothetical protein